ncbi:hypothetical protein [Luteolibacter soli]|uniref:Lipoprotein n=1 Tax=Luteolibacter soli TaxID=3135280 RepID=A0ABU9APP6_9BACT
MLPALWVGACSGTGGDSSASKPAAEATAAADPAAKPFRMKTGDNGDDDYGKMANKFGSASPYATGPDGKPMGEYKTAAGFDKANSQFNKGYAGKAYQAGEYKAKSFWGSKDYAKAVYGGNTDGNGLRKASKFDGSAAGEGTKTARDAGRNFKTGDYGTGATRDAGKEITKFAGAENARQSEMVTDAEIVPWQQQHGMTIEETKGKMGR